jgi:hypothetical protein
MKQQLPGIVLVTQIGIALSGMCLHFVVVSYDLPDYKIEQLGNEL